MSWFNPLTWGVSESSDNEVRCFTVEHPSGYEYEIVASQEDAHAILAGSDRTIVDDQPYEEPRRKLFGIF